MTYAIERYRGFGDVESDLSAEASASAQSAVPNQSASQSLIAYAKTAKQVKDYYGQFSKYTGGFPKKLTFDSATKWGEKALYSYGKDQLKKYGKKEIDQVASNYGLQGCVPDHLPASEKEAVHDLVDLAAAGACVALDINPKLGIVTADALYDGHISAEECASIGAVAGAVAGAAACQMFGIPAPIGAFVGGKLGSLAGQAFASIFGISSDAYKRWVNEQKKIVHKIYADAYTQCYSIRRGYWDLFDKLIVTTELQWEARELMAGSLFALRWYQPTPGFYQWIEQLGGKYPSQIDGPYCQTFCHYDRLGMRGKPIYSGNKPYILTHSDTDQLALAAKCAPLTVKGLFGSIQSDGIRDLCAYGCSVDYGCLYPRFDAWHKPVVPTDPKMLGNSQRVIDAFMAQGIEWLPPATGTDVSILVGAGARTPRNASERNIFCNLPEATSKEIKDKTKTKKYRNAWVNYLNRIIEVEEQKITSLQTVSVAIIADLIQTAARVKAENEMVKIAAKAKQEQVLLLSGFGATEQKGQITGQLITDPGAFRNALINDGALLAGGALLASSILRR